MVVLTALRRVWVCAGVYVWVRELLVLGLDREFWWLVCLICLFLVLFERLFACDFGGL